MRYMLLQMKVKYIKLLRSNNKNLASSNAHATLVA